MYEWIRESEKSTPQYNLIFDFTKTESRTKKTGITATDIFVLQIFMTSKHGQLLLLGFLTCMADWGFT